jgi:hypothetical protein
MSQNTKTTYVCINFFYVAGITYGFSVMTSCESPNIPFTVFRTRFVSGELPKIINYTNSVC